jgi:23S rRNA pseudouridine2605 synthase
MRINKFLASCGAGLSRRKSEALVLDGAVSVNGKTVRDLATDVSETDTVAVNGRACRPADAKIYIAMNKPKRIITACEDKRGRKTVIDVLAEAGYRGARVFPVGRLDYDTEGLLLLTNDGDWAESITHPSHEIAKVYAATLDKPFAPADLAALETGIEIDGEMTRPAHAKIAALSTVEIAITEGRHRQVRKMFASLGYDVVSLRRISIGSIKLGALRPGSFTILPAIPKI